VSGAGDVNGDGLADLIVGSYAYGNYKQPSAGVSYVVFSPVCHWDLDGDGTVGINDFLNLLAAWGTDPGGPPDFDGDGDVGIRDFLELLANWGPCPLFVDCNGNRVWDVIDVQDGTSQDCNGNVVPDDCDIADSTSQDCNDNGVPDECDLADGTSNDLNGNGIPDECKDIDCNKNGVSDLVDLADGTSQDCNGNLIPDECDIADGTSPDCNRNSIPDECDLADGTSEDCNGDGIPDECGVPNDCCTGAIVISDGPTPFLTLDASTDGPPAIGCEDAVVPFVNDIWFLYTASCTGFATFSLCNNADFDTRLAVYFAGSCPPSLNPLVCSDNAPGCGQTSEVQQFVGAGISYLVRVGGAKGGGAGTLTVSCETP